MVLISSSSQTSPPFHPTLSEGINVRIKTWHFTQLVSSHSKFIRVLNYLPPVHTLFLHPSLRSCQDPDAAIPIENPTLDLSSSCKNLKSFKTPKKTLKNWILWTNRKIFDQIPKDGWPLLPLLQSSVRRSLCWPWMCKKTKSIRKRCFRGGEERPQRQQGQSKSKLGSTVQTQAVRTQRGRDGCLWSW